MGFGAWKGCGRVSCTWESIGSSSDMGNKRASGNDSQVKSRKRVGEGNMAGWGCAAAPRAWAGEPGRRPVPRGAEGRQTRSGPKKPLNLLRWVP